MEFVILIIATIVLGLVWAYEPEKNRVKRGGGSGAIACCADAERAHKQERKDSREDSPGCAGVGEALDELAEYARSQSIQCAKNQIERDKYPHPEGAAYYSGLATAYADMHARIRNAKPKPDNEARNERIGRRNNPAQPPE